MRLPRRRGRWPAGCESIGVEYEGLGGDRDGNASRRSADFSDLALDPDVLLRWIICPETGTMVVMVPMGPKKWGPNP